MQSTCIVRSNVQLLLPTSSPQLFPLSWPSECVGQVNESSTCICSSDTCTLTLSCSVIHSLTLTCLSSCERVNEWISEWTAQLFFSLKSFQTPHLLSPLPVFIFICLEMPKVTPNTEPVFAILPFSTSMNPLLANFKWPWSSLLLYPGVYSPGAYFNLRLLLTIDTTGNRQKLFFPFLHHQFYLLYWCYSKSN